MSYSLAELKKAYNTTIKMNKKMFDDCIDMALSTKDEQWFYELVNTYPELNQSKKKIQGCNCQTCRKQKEKGEI